MIDLQEQFKNKIELEITKEHLENQIEVCRSKQTLKATVYDKENVQGGKKGNYQEDLIIKICDLERTLSFTIKEIENLTNYIEKMKVVAGNYGDDSIKIFELRKKGKTIQDIAEELFISETKVRYTLDKLGLVKHRKED